MIDVDLIAGLAVAGGLALSAWALGRWSGYERGWDAAADALRFERRNVYDVGVRHGRVQMQFCPSSAPSGASVLANAAGGHSALRPASPAGVETGEGAHPGAQRRKRDCAPGLMARTDSADALEDR